MHILKTSFNYETLLQTSYKILLVVMQYLLCTIYLFLKTRLSDDA